MWDCSQKDVDEAINAGKEGNLCETNQKLFDCIYKAGSFSQVTKVLPI